MVIIPNSSDVPWHSPLDLPERPHQVIPAEVVTQPLTPTLAASVGDL